MKLNIKKKFQEYARVLKITRKPTVTEFSGSSKITGIGMLVIGGLGLLIFIICNAVGLFG